MPLAVYRQVACHQRMAGVLPRARRVIPQPHRVGRLPQLARCPVPQREVWACRQIDRLGQLQRPAHLLVGAANGERHRVALGSRAEVGCRRRRPGGSRLGSAVSRPIQHHRPHLASARGRDARLGEKLVSEPQPLHRQLRAARLPDDDLDPDLRRGALGHHLHEVGRQRVPLAVGPDLLAARIPTAANRALPAVDEVVARAAGEPLGSVADHEIAGLRADLLRSEGDLEGHLPARSRGREDERPALVGHAERRRRLLDPSRPRLPPRS